MSSPAAGRPRDRILSDALPRLLAHAAHDLNNQLATILGKAEVGLMLDDPARWRRSLEDAFAAGQRARVLVSDLQHVARWQQDGSEPVTVGDALALAARFAGRPLERCGATLRVDASVPGRILEDPAAVAIGMSLLLRAAADGRTPTARAWRLSARRDPDGWSATLELGDDVIDAARLHENGALALAEIGAEFVVEHGRIRVRFRD